MRKLNLNFQVPSVFLASLLVFVPASSMMDDSENLRERLCNHQEYPHLYAFLAVRYRLGFLLIRLFEGELLPRASARHPNPHDDRRIDSSFP